MMLNGAHGHLQEHLRRNAISLTRYLDVKGVSEKYFKSRSLSNGRNAKKISASIDEENREKADRRGRENTLLQSLKVWAFVKGLCFVHFERLWF